MNHLVSFIAAHGFQAWIANGTVKAVMIGNTAEGYPISFMPETIRNLKEARDFLGY